MILIENSDVNMCLVCTNSVQCYSFVKLLVQVWWVSSSLAYILPMLTVTRRPNRRELTPDRILALLAIITSDSPWESGAAGQEILANHNRHRSHVTSHKNVWTLAWRTWRWVGCGLVKYVLLEAIAVKAVGPRWLNCQIAAIERGAKK